VTTARTTSETREHRLLLQLCARDSEVDAAELAQEVVAPLDWNGIFLSAMWHKVLFIAYERLKRARLLDAALVSGNLPLLLLNHWKQLHAVNGIRNDVHMTELAAVAGALDDAGLRFAVAKGGPLLFDRVYSRTERKCYDVDLLADKGELPRIQDALQSQGFVIANYNHSTGDCTPLPQEERRKWLLHTRGMPNFVKPLDLNVMSYMVLQIQFKVGSTAPGNLALDAGSLLERRVPYRGFWAVSDVDLLLQLALHLHRETTEASFEASNMSFNLIKFCDLDRFTALLASSGQLSALVESARDLGLLPAVRRAYQMLWELMPSPPCHLALELIGGEHDPQPVPAGVREKVFKLGQALPRPATAWD
jgi:hypothetical protein